MLAAMTPAAVRAEAAIAGQARLLVRRNTTSAIADALCAHSVVKLAAEAVEIAEAASTFSADSKYLPAAAPILPAPTESNAGR